MYLAMPYFIFFFSLLYSYLWWSHTQISSIHFPTDSLFLYKTIISLFFRKWGPCPSMSYCLFCYGFLRASCCKSINTLNICWMLMRMMTHIKMRTCWSVFITFSTGMARWRSKDVCSLGSIQNFVKKLVFLSLLLAFLRMEILVIFGGFRDNFFAC